MERRPNWNEYFIQMAEVVRRRATCLRRKVGAIIVKDHRILSTGYNGASKGLKHWTEIGTCLREELNISSGERHEICRGVHAEQNAIIQAAVFGSSIEGATLYATNFPCCICAKMIINAGIERVVYKEEYKDELAVKLFKEANVEIDCVNIGVIK